MRRLIVIGCLVLLSLGASAQRTMVPSVSNYHLTWTTLNPAFSGFRDAISLSSLYRSPLYGKVGPVDMQLNVHSPVGNSKVAVGAILSYNTTPPQNNIYNFMTTYAYRIYLGSGRLSFGLSAGMVGYNSDLSGLDLRDSGDPLFGEDKYQRWFPQFATGLLYYTDRYFFGISIPELMSVPLDGQSLGKVDMEDTRILLSGAYRFDVGEHVALKPSVLIDYNQAVTTFKATMNAGFMDARVYVGAGYMHPQYAVATLNFMVNPQWLIGYAYTIHVTPLGGALGGGHEVVLRWELRPVIRTIQDDPFYF
ncbi:MAG: PorP/SprF family type IX secretion system membrane protein [Bacteroidales bacterium]